MVGILVSGSQCLLRLKHAFGSPSFNVFSKFWVRSISIADWYKIFEASSFRFVIDRWTRLVSILTVFCFKQCVHAGEQMKSFTDILFSCFLCFLLFIVNYGWTLDSVYFSLLLIDLSGVRLFWSFKKIRMEVRGIKPCACASRMGSERSKLNILYENFWRLLSSLLKLMIN